MPVELPVDLIKAANLDAGNLSLEAAKLLALELFREDRVSLGRAAELCQIPLEAFMQFAGEHEVPLHYGPAELEQDRRTSERLNL
jgi:predicted HTH domain antitoxin